MNLSEFIHSFVEIIQIGRFRIRTSRFEYSTDFIAFIHCKSCQVYRSDSTLIMYILFLITLFCIIFFFFACRRIHVVWNDAKCVLGYV